MSKRKQDDDEETQTKKAAFVMTMSTSMPRCVNASARSGALTAATLPETHTCTRELHLPNYSSVEVLRAKLATALEHIDDGFHKE